MTDNSNDQRQVIPQAILDDINREYECFEENVNEDSVLPKRVKVKARRGKIQVADEDDEPLCNFVKKLKRKREKVLAVCAEGEADHSENVEEEGEPDYVCSVESSSDEDEDEFSVENKNTVKKLRIVPARRVKKPRKIGKYQSNSNLKLIGISDDIEEAVIGRTLNQRVPPRQFMTAVLKDIPESHKTAIRDIGFGGFLDLDLDSHKSGFAEKIVKSFDVDRCSLVMLNNEEIELGKEDIEVVYGLPFGGIEIQEPKDEDDDEWSNFLMRWRSLFGLKNGSPTNAAVIRELEKLKNEALCDDFLFHFVICVVNCCIRSTTNQALNYKFLYSCMDIKQISKLDWCGFAFKHLVESVIEWKQRSSFFTGPLPFLLICYFDRLQRGQLEYPRLFPLISVWKKELICKRMKVENERGFGRGKVLKRIVYERVVQTEAPKRPEEREVGEGSSCCPNEMVEFLIRFQNLAKMLATNMNDMYVMLEKTHDMFDEGEINVQMSTLIQNIWSKYTTRKEENMSQGREEEPGTGKDAGEFPKILSQDHHLFNEPAFMAELDMVMTKAYEKFKGGKGRKKSVSTMSPPSFDLFSEPVVLEEPGDERTPVHATAASNAASDVEDRSTVHATAASTAVAEVEDENAMFIDEDEMEKRSKFNEDRVSMREKRIVKVPAHLRSPFMVESDYLFNNMVAAKRRIVEYAFSNGDPIELLYDDNLTVIIREEILSLSGNQHVVSNIVDAWSSILNSANKRKNANDVNRFFFTTTPFVMLCTDHALPGTTKPEERYESLFERFDYEISYAQVSSLDSFQLENILKSKCY